MRGAAFLEAMLRVIFLNEASDEMGLGSSAVAGNLWLAWHSANPTEAGTQATSEAAYPSYGRTAVARSPAGFSVDGKRVTNTSLIRSPASTGGAEVILTHWSLGYEQSGPTKIAYYGPSVHPVAIVAGKSPAFPAGAIIITEGP